MQQGYNVFISYRGAGSGGLLGKEIYTDIKNAPPKKGQPNVIPFFAPACIPKGENFKETIRLVINNVSCVVLILSKGFFEKCAESDDMVRFELKEALKNPNITFIPVIMEGFSFEEELSAITNIFSEEEISRFKHINAINHHGIYDFNTEEDVLPIIRRAIASGGIKHITEPFKGNSTKDKSIRKAAPMIALCVLATILVLILALPLLKDENPQNNSNPLGISSVLSSNVDNKNQSENSQPIQSNVQTSENVLTSSKLSTSSNTTQKPNQSTNQIPEKHNNEVEALKHSSPLALANSTLRVKVGEYITPMAASTWKNVTIYSQDTNIAVAEGLTVRGVSRGETYIIVESYLGSTTAYYVIVE